MATVWLLYSADEKFRVDLDAGHKAQYWEEMVGLWSTIKMPEGGDLIGDPVKPKFDAATALTPGEMRTQYLSVSRASAEQQKAKTRKVLLENAEIKDACERFHQVICCMRCCCCRRQKFPGSLGHEEQDAQTYKKWGVVFVKKYA